LVADGKHTDCHTGTLSAKDQIQLMKAAIMLKDVLGDSLSQHRALFFTNREKETDAGTDEYDNAVEEYGRTFDDGSSEPVNLETIGEKTFEFAPFSDLLFMRRNKRS
jgi:hypothetical protein